VAQEKVSAAREQEERPQDVLSPAEVDRVEEGDGPDAQEHGPGDDPGSIAAASEPASDDRPLSALLGDEQERRKVPGP